ncbi:MAG: hypothetical protein ACYSSP_14170 [Planctomycetota bacterium]|jgi:hypothetical protein
METIYLPDTGYKMFIFCLLLTLFFLIFGILKLYVLFRKTILLYRKHMTELPPEIGKPRAFRLWLNYYFFIYTVLIVGSAFAARAVWLQGFNSMQYNDKALYLYHPRTSKPTIVDWVDISNIELKKKAIKTNWIIIVYTKDGQVFKSATWSTRKTGQVENAYKKLKVAYEQSKEYPS